MNNKLLSPHVFVFCAPSRTCDPEYHQVARQLGKLLARHFDNVFSIKEAPFNCMANVTVQLKMEN